MYGLNFKTKYRALFALFLTCIFLVGCFVDWTSISEPRLTTNNYSKTIINIRWTAPITGSPVVKYILQDSIGSKQFKTVAEPTDTFTSVSVATGVVHIFRVAGVDSMNRQGCWSEKSDPLYIDPTPNTDRVPMIQLGD